MLSVHNGARAVEFYQAAFGAQVLFRHDEAKAGVVARLSLAKSESPEHFNFGPETLGWWNFKNGCDRRRSGRG